MMGMGMASQADKPLPAADSPALSRKIVYDAQIDLITENVDPIAKKLTALVQEARGYIAEENTTGSPGSQRSMHWKIRLPVDQFDAFVGKIVALGELERNSRTSQDVTEQFYDIEARIKNKKAEEKTITKILEERTGKLEEVLKVEVELSRVRGEIEQLEGKIRVLENLSAGHPHGQRPRAREISAPAPRRGRLPHPDRPDLVGLGPGPGRSPQGHHTLGRRLGHLAPPVDRLGRPRVDPAAG